MSASDVLADQQELIERLLTCFPRSWQCAFLNYEFEDHPSGAVSDYVAFHIVKPLFGCLQKQQFNLGANETFMLNRICRSLLTAANQKQITLDLLLKRKGERYKLFVNYGEPERLNGNLTYSLRHLRYVEHEPMLAKIK